MCVCVCVCVLSTLTQSTSIFNSHTEKSGGVVIMHRDTLTKSIHF